MAFRIRYARLGPLVLATMNLLAAGLVVFGGNDVVPDRGTRALFLMIFIPQLFVWYWIVALYERLPPKDSTDE